MEINQLCEFIRRVVADKAPTANVTITMERGPRYTRVVSSKWGQRSAYCFVDNATGDILKPDSWKRPAKQDRKSTRLNSSH